MSGVWRLAGAAELPDPDDWLADGERAKLATLRFPRRRSDWRLGRWVAKQALVGLLALEPGSAGLRRLEIRNDEEGAPFAFRDGRPLEAAVSISHRGGAGLAVAAPGGVAVGCDLEIVEPSSQAFVADYFDAAERAGIEAAPGAERTLRIALAWSAKESALKALGTGLRRDTRELRVEAGPAVADPASWRPLRVRVADEGAFDGWWRREGVRLLTVVSRPGLPAPRALAGAGSRGVAAFPPHQPPEPADPLKGPTSSGVTQPP